MQWKDGRFLVTFEDHDLESPQVFDRIWLCTGWDNDAARYPVLQDLCRALPIEIAQGLPVLNRNLSWGHPPPLRGGTHVDHWGDEEAPSPTEEGEAERIWKQRPRRRLCTAGTCKWELTTTHSSSTVPFVLLLERRSCWF